MSRKDFDPAAVEMDGRPASQARLFDPAHEGPWRGSLEGIALGGPVAVLAYGTDETGVGHAFTCTPMLRPSLSSRAVHDFSSGMRRLMRARERLFSGRQACRTNLRI
jgi:hypothetical protein